MGSHERTKTPQRTRAKESESIATLNTLNVNRKDFILDLNNKFLTG